MRGWVRFPGRRVASWLEADSANGFGVTAACRSPRWRITQGTLWLLAGAVSSQGLALLASAVTARLLGRTAFGQLGAVQSTSAMAGALAGLGLGITAARHIAEFRDGCPDRVRLLIPLILLASLVMGTAASLLVFLAAPWMAKTVLGEPLLEGAVRLSAPCVLCNTLLGAQVGVLSGLESFKAIAKLNLWRGLLALPVTVVAVWFWNVQGAVGAMVVVGLAGCLLGHSLSLSECYSRGIQLQLQGIWTERGVLWGSSVPAFLSGAVVATANWLAVALLVHQPGGYAEMGLWSAANDWRNVSVFLPSLIAQSAVPILSNLAGRREVLRFREGLSTSLWLSTASSMLTALVLAFGARPVLRMNGEGFERGYPVLLLLVAASVLYSVNTVIGASVASAGSLWLAFLFNALWATLYLTCVVCWVPAWNAVGLAAATLAAYVAHSLWQGAYVVHKLRCMRQAVSFAACDTVQL